MIPAGSACVVATPTVPNQGWDEVAWTVPEFERAEIDRAGRVLLWSQDQIWQSPPSYDHALHVVNNWRSSHSFPLNTFQATLRRRARTVDKDAIVVQRLKRLPSIEGKLARQTTRLTQMQDIGGCRAIVHTASQLDKLVALYKKSDVKNPSKSATKRHEFVRERDYVASPKSDGYRGVHLIYRYHSRARKHSCYNDLLIEVQLRTRLQHLWATAVETASIFTGQALKWRGGHEDWKRFFALMGSDIALREKRTTVPGTPTYKDALTAELRALVTRLRVDTVMRGWTVATQFVTGAPHDARIFLLRHDIQANKVYVGPYLLAQQQQATEDYLAAEKDIEDRQLNEQVVLVSAESIEALPRAYPNYYADTDAFLTAVKTAIS